MTCAKTVGGDFPGETSDRNEISVPAAMKTTLGLLPMLAVSAAFSTSAYAQSTNVPLEEITVGGGGGNNNANSNQDAGGPAPQAAPTPPPSPPLPGQAGPVAPGSFKADFSTSPKMTAPLLNIPQTVTVISGTVIEQTNARNLTEALRSTPGISFNAGENGFGTSPTNFQLRGFDSSANIFIDGARDSGSYARDTFNIEQVEVVKGAASDNGRGGAGGYINMITKAPKQENFVRGEALIGFDQYDSEMRRRATIDVNQHSGNVAVRMNGMIEDSGVAGREMAENNAYGLAPSIAFGLNTDFRAIFSYEHLERDDRPDWGVPGQTIPGTLYYNPRYKNAPRDAFYGLRSDFDDVSTNAVTARFEYDVSDNTTVTNQTRWAEVDRQSRYTHPNPPESTTLPGGTNPLVATATQLYDRYNTSITNQTNVATRFSTGSWRHTVSTGIEITREESRGGNTPAALPAPGSTPLYDPNPDRVKQSLFRFTEKSDIEIDTIAAYAFDTIELNRQWQITGGLRAEHYQVDITDTGGSIGDNFSDSESTLGGRIGLVYKPVENGSFYGAFGISHLPPGSYLSTSDISRGGDNSFPNLRDGAKPVEMHNYEIGTKWDWFGGALTTTAALFRTEKHNVAITGRDPGETVTTLKGYGEQIAQGLELGIAGNLTDQWKVFGGAAFIDTERKHSAYLDDVRRRANPADYGPYLRTNGDELAFTPNVTATLWTTYDVTDAFTIGGGVQYVGESWAGRPDDAERIIPNGIKGKLPDYFLVNFMTSYDLTENVELRFNVDNVFDETYAQSMNWGARRATLGPPRTFWLSTSIDF